MMLPTMAQDAGKSMYGKTFMGIARATRQLPCPQKISGKLTIIGWNWRELAPA